MLLLSKCLSNYSTSCVLYKQKKQKTKEGKRKIETNLDVLELESKCDNSEHRDENLIWNPVVKQKTLSFERRMRSRTCQSLHGAGAEVLFLGSWRELANYTLGILNRVIFLPEVSDLCFSHMEMFSSFTLSKCSEFYYRWLTVTDTGKKNSFLANLHLIGLPQCFAISANH